MWEKIGKVMIVNVIALIIIITCSTITIISIFKPIPPESKDLVNQYFNLCLLGVLGWAFTQAKNQKTP
jgi:hypothetical protein